MYFWRIGRLKADLAARPLSDREALPYLIVSAAVWVMVTAFPASSFNVWDALSVGWSVLLAIFGTIFIYRQNGCAAGQQFLQRYFAIGWVVAVRWFAALVVAMVALFFVLEALGLWSDVTTRYEVLFIAAAELIVYWRIGHHVGDVARASNTA